MDTDIISVHISVSFGGRLLAADNCLNRRSMYCLPQSITILCKSQGKQKGQRSSLVAHWRLVRGGGEILFLKLQFKTKLCPNLRIGKNVLMNRLGVINCNQLRLVESKSKLLQTKMQKTFLMF